MGFRVGEEILRCEPYAHVVSLSLAPLVCDYCLHYPSVLPLDHAKANDRIKKCTACAVIHFCGQACFKKAWAE